MKRRKKIELYIPLTREDAPATAGRRLLHYLIPALFLVAVIVSIFFVKGSLLPGDGQPAYKESKEVILPMVRVSTLNPLASRDEDTYYVSRLVYDSLFVMDETMTPTESLVSGYQFDRSNDTLTLDLREGVKWQDGKTLTAKDVSYSISVIRSAGADSLYTAVSDAIDNVKVLDTYRLRIYFSSGTEMGLDLLTFPVLPAHQYKTASKAAAAGEGFKPVGTGPYAFKSYDPTTELVLVPNGDHAGGAPENQLVFRVLPTNSNLFNLLKASSLSLIVSRDADRETRISGSDVTSVNFPQDRVEMLGYNMAGAATQKRSIRKAIACAIDVQGLIDECYYGSGIRSGSLYYPDYLGIGADEDLYAYSRDDAKAFIEAAGYADSNGDGYVELPDGSPLVLRFLVNRENGSRVAAAKAITAELKKVGLDTDLQIFLWDEYVAALRSGAFDLYLGGIKVTPAMDFRPWLAGGGAYNFTGYKNGRLEDLLNQFRSGQDPEGLVSAFTQIQDILDEDLPYYSLFYKTSGAILSPALQGEVAPLFTDYYRNSGGWTCLYEVTPETEDSE
jgi:peptide/nickel transport system substrate-binding protein